MMYVVLKKSIIMVLKHHDYDILFGMYFCDGVTLNTI